MSQALSRAPLSGADWFAVELDPATSEVVMLDQRLLPAEVRYHRFRSADEVADAIRNMVVRGAPAIGIAAAYTLAMVARDERSDARMFLVANGTAGRILNATRPTAVNLAWAIARMSRRAGDVAELAPEARYQGMLEEAEAIHREDVASCKRMGELGAADVPDGARRLVHVRRGKGHKDRFVPLPDLTHRALRALWAKHRHPRLLFPNPVGSAESIARARTHMNRGGVQQAVKALVAVIIFITGLGFTVIPAAIASFHFNITKKAALTSFVSGLVYIFILIITNNLIPELSIASIVDQTGKQ